MKKSLVIFFVFGIIAFYSCNSETKTKETTSVEIEKQVLTGNENKGEAKIVIEGMTCPMGCAKTIEKKLSLTEGVLSADVNFEEKTAYINYNPEQVNEKQLIEVIENIADGAYKAIKAEVKEERKEKHSEVKNNTSSSNSDDDIQVKKSYNLYIPDIFSAIAKFYSL
ncbi:MAG: heavy-metal-associated domain-containing protein [Bacteroidetes bacterium]|nr:MAG: heavy-metal-associated domain-containing protein [Bacteroidota bacterium]